MLRALLTACVIAGCSPMLGDVDVAIVAVESSIANPLGSEVHDGAAVTGGDLTGKAWLQNAARVYYDAEQDGDPARSDGTGEDAYNLGSDGSGAHCTKSGVNGMIWNDDSPDHWSFVGSGNQGCQRDWDVSIDFAAPYVACARVSADVASAGVDSIYGSFDAGGDRSALRLTTSENYAAWDSGGTYVQDAATGPHNDAAYHSVCGLFNGASSAIWVDGAERATGNLSGGDGLMGITIGYNYAKGADWDGRLVALYFIDGSDVATAAGHMATGYP